jgi:transcription elongation factor Elf1
MSRKKQKQKQKQKRLVSRLTETKKSVEESQELIKECLPKLKEAYKKLVIEAGLCGTAPASALNKCVERLDYYSKLSFQDIIEWN